MPPIVIHKLPDEGPGYPIIPLQNKNGTMTVNGVTVDITPISNGLYRMITENGEAHVVAQGMIPKWIADLFEKKLRRCLIAQSCIILQCTPEELLPRLDEARVTETMGPICRAVAVGIYAAAAREGKLNV